MSRATGKKISLLLAVTLAVFSVRCAADQSKQDMTTASSDKHQPRVLQRIVVGQIWPAVSVGFSLVTHGDKQYVAYYNADRRMVVAMRSLGDDKFVQKVLPSKSDHPPRGPGNTSTIQGWDSHNYIVMAVDSAGYIHLSGNMHVNGLTYFRSEKPGDITTMQQVDAMVGNEETHCTYPQFLTGTDGKLLFHYRSGWSGNGFEVYNIYDPATRKWQRFLDKPLISGLGKCNAYQRGPTPGPDGWYHLIWMWRETSDVVTNHDLSYARSKDLKNWRTAAGQPLALPITPKDTDTVIDPVPQRGGLHNSFHRIGFDSRGRVVVTYYKYDANGDTQAYAARFDDGAWRIHQISKWRGRHKFEGGGSGPATFGTSVSIGAIRQYHKGEMALSFHHWLEGDGLLVVNEDTLELIRVDPAPQHYPPALMKVTSDFPGMHIKWRGDGGKSPDPASRYVLRWETLGANRDRPRTGDLPTTGDLVIYKITAGD